MGTACPSTEWAFVVPGKRVRETSRRRNIMNARPADGAGNHGSADNTSFLVGWRPPASRRMKSEIRNAVALLRRPCQQQEMSRPAFEHAAHKPADCLNYSSSSHYRLNLSTNAPPWGVRLTVEDLDGDGLFLLDGLCVRETGVADVVVPRILSKHVGEVQVSVEGLGHPAALRQPLEVWNGQENWLLLGNGANSLLNKRPPPALLF